MRQAVAALHVRELVQQDDARRSSGQHWPSGISTDGGRCLPPWALEARLEEGQAARMPRPEEFHCSGSHGASTTRTVRRDIQLTA